MIDNKRRPESRRALPQEGETWRDKDRLAEELRAQRMRVTILVWIKTGSVILAVLAMAIYLLTR